MNSLATDTLVCLQARIKSDEDFSRLYKQSWNGIMQPDSDERVLARILSDVEHAYNRKESKHYIERRDYLPFLRAIRVLIRNNDKLGAELIALSTLIERQD